jgi:hypothetical protein
VQQDEDHRDRRLYCWMRNLFKLPEFWLRAHDGGRWTDENGWQEKAEMIAHGVVLATAWSGASRPIYSAGVAG